jgi:DUF1680 family protein
LNDGSVTVNRTTQLSWDGNINLLINEAPKGILSLFMRIPGWCHNARIIVNGKAIATKINSGSYAEVRRKWTKGDQLQLILEMPATLIEANPLVEATRNQVAVKRGPVVYCLEFIDLPKNNSVFGIDLPLNAQFKMTPLKIGNEVVVALETTGKKSAGENWNNQFIRRYLRVPLK